ncbi:TM0996/MTH895 family glutaredoxin-like protein [Candidatus Calescamantes bacterium]|nr:TM0996/MTH895 family glutaredoxin-like protein [Candidatus Calescamantes bacterium]
MKIEVLGAGCPKCKKTEANVREAIQRLGISAEVAHVYDMKEIILRGVSQTPAVMVDGKLVVAGRVPEVEELMELLKKK